MGTKVGDGHKIGSVSKSITGLAVALLIQDGKLTLDSELGPVLGEYFKKRGRAMDPSLEKITIRRLLSHTAGLRTNYTSDPANGINNNHILPRAAFNSHSWVYLTMAGADVSNGSDKFVYSNISYLLLGLVVEAVSGLDYEEFCKQRIFQPLGLTTAESAGGGWRILLPFAGWWMTPAELIKIWNSFVLKKPELLKAGTLRNTLLADVGQPLGQDERTRYVMGAYVRKSADGKAYTISHSGIADFYREEERHFTFIEATSGGVVWTVMTMPTLGAGAFSGIPRDVRAVVQKALAK
jgi:D-alanyl-D-alanine carboxypeptidase